MAGKVARAWEAAVRALTWRRRYSMTRSNEVAALASSQLERGYFWGGGGLALRSGIVEKMMGRIQLG